MLRINAFRMTTFLLLSLCFNVPVVLGAPGLCTGDVTLSIGLDASITAAPFIEELLVAYATNRSSVLGYSVKVNIVSVPTSVALQPSFNTNGQFSPPLHGVVFEINAPFLFRGTPEFQAFSVVATAAVVVHNIQASQTLQIDLSTVADIYAGTINEWNDSRLAIDNPDFPFPNGSISAVVRIDDAPATRTFTAGLANFSTTWNQTHGVFSDPRISVVNESLYSTSWQRFIPFYGYRSVGCAGTLSTIPDSLGYLTWAVATQYNSAMVNIRNDAGQWVAPTMGNIAVTVNAIIQTYLNLSSTFEQAYPRSLIEFTNFGSYMHYNDCCIAQEIAALLDPLILNENAIAAYNDLLPIDESDSFAKSRIQSRITCGTKATNAYTEGYLVSIAAQNTTTNNNAIIGGIAATSVALLIAIVGVTYAAASLRRSKQRDERQWNHADDSIVADVSQQPDTPQGSRLALPGSPVNGYQGVQEAKFPMRRGRFLEDGRLALLQEALLASPNHWKSTTKAFAFDRYRRGIRLPVTVSKFVGAWANHENLATHILYDFCAKGSLHYVLKANDDRLEDDIRFNMAFDVAHGMRYLHGQKIVHGSLNSLSCFVDANWRVKIVGWMYDALSNLEGARVFSIKQTVIKVMIGAEQMVKFEELVALIYLEPSDEMTPRMDADVYSFGLLMIEIFTSHLPYKSEIWAADHMTINYNDLIAFLRQKFIDRRISPPKLDGIPQMIRISALKCIRTFDRPSFDTLALLLDEHRPLKHNIVDLMMEKMDNYVRLLEERIDEATQEHRRLLHEMLPPKIASDLLAGCVSPPESFECISVCFLDICGFTTLSATSTPIEVLTFLNTLWSDYETVVSKFDAYKVDTIGDAYMVCSGLPERNRGQHVKIVCDIALAFLACARTFRIAHRPEDELKVRIGLNSGPAVAGVIGKKMPQYCVFGDTINTAARMASTSEPMRIQMSEAICTLLEASWGDACTVEPRGELEVKGKGSMKTFWLLGNARFSESSE